MDKTWSKTDLFAIRKSYKKRFFLALFSSFILISCNFNKKKTARETSGKINSVSVIIDDQLWIGEIGDTLRNKFAAPVFGLPQEEPIFTINQYPVKLLEGFMNNSRNIIVIKKETKSRFEIIENEFSEPQNVIHISGKSILEIIDTIQKNAPKIIQKIKETEILEIQKQTKKALQNTDKINQKFNILLDVPNTYKYVMRKNNFIWLKKEITSGSTSILIYQIPIRGFKNQKNITNKVIKTRDSIGQLYIHGTAANTKMLTENSYSPYSSKIILNENEAYETKGTWEMKNDFMSGPFINYSILDKSHNRVLVIEGFCYAPSKEKRDLMMELEAVIKSVKFPKSK